MDIHHPDPWHAPVAVTTVLVLLMMEAETVRDMYSDLAVTNKQYCQSCILLILYILYPLIVHNTQYSTLIVTRIPLSGWLGLSEHFTIHHIFFKTMGECFGLPFKLVTTGLRVADFRVTYSFPGNNCLRKPRNTWTIYLRLYDKLSSSIRVNIHGWDVIPRIF
jgi:hypothetical protein